MHFNRVAHNLESALNRSLDANVNTWLQEKIEIICDQKSTKELYLTYSLLASKLRNDGGIHLTIDDDALKGYLESQKATPLQMARIYLLVRVLEENRPFFEPKVANIIQVADTGELVTFLKYLILLPEAGFYKQAAVEALRTNIDTVFDAISAKNPYPAAYFNDQQWNQMYLKAAFMQRDLSAIPNIDERANQELARIISDYAHERWAASRKIDPLFWRPVTHFLDEPLLADMQRLLASEDILENKAGALCCSGSTLKTAQELIKNYPELMRAVETGDLAWETLKSS